MKTRGLALVLVWVLWGGSAWAVQGDIVTLCEMYGGNYCADLRLLFKDQSDGNCGSQVWSTPDGCLQKMEQAMRAMDEHVQETTSAVSFDGCNTCGPMGCGLLACTGDREVPRLEWALQEAKAAQAKRNRKVKALQQWEQVKKECWDQN